MKRKQISKILSGALAFGMLLSQGQAYNVLAQNPLDVVEIESSQYNANTDINSENIMNLTPEQREAIKQLQTFNERAGLQLSEDVNLDSSKTVSVIVEFKNKPQKVAVLEAAVKGEELSSSTAKVNAETDHITFKKDLQSVFKTKSDGTYNVIREYKHAFNGVALEVPANKLKDLVKSSAVHAIYSNSNINAVDPVQETPPLKEATGQGMAAERSFLKVNELHKEGFTGKGIKVGVLDTGIDYNHPDLKDVYKGGYDTYDNDSDPMETTYNDWVNAGKPGGIPTGYVTSHGTHVAGTIAGQGTNDSPASTLGIAPDVDLYAYRVLGPKGGTEGSVIGGIDRAIADGMDIMNLSLGATVNHPFFPTSIAINNAVLSGVTAIVAAGNSGDKMYTLGSPGTSGLALTVGASDVPTEIPTMKGHLDNVNLDMQLLAKGYDDNLSALLDKPYTVVNVPGFGTANDYRSIDVTGKIALVQRGNNSVNDKILQAKLKGAAAVLIFNNVEDGYMPFYLAEGVDFIPAFNLTLADGVALKQKVAAGQTQFTFSDIGKQATQGDELASFSSRGPSLLNYDIKPEVVAPGVSVLSTVPGFINSPSDPTDFKYAYERMSGTSMATPFTTGVAALLLQAKPDLQPADVKSILMNTADPLSKPYSVFEQGAGRVDPYEAIHSSIEIKVQDKTPSIVNGRIKEIKDETAAISYGNVVFNGKDVADTRSITLMNKGKETKTFNVKVVFQTNLRGSKDAKLNGVTVNTVSSITVKGNEEKKTSVDLTIPKTAEKGIYEGYVEYTNKANSSETYQVPFGMHYVEEGFKDFTLTRQTLSNDRNGINPLSDPNLIAKFKLKSHMRYIDVVLTDAITGKDLGITNAFDGLYYGEEQEYNILAFGGYYYPFVGDGLTTISPKTVMPKPGHYKVKLIGYNDAGETYTISQDLFIDNEMPNKFDIQVEGEKEGNPFIEYKTGQQTVPFTAVVNDKIVDVMKEAGLNVDQSINSIFYWYDNPFNPNGKLVLDANGKINDEIAMKPSLDVLTVKFQGIDQAVNSYGQKQYYFVNESTPYVVGQANVKTRLNVINARIGDTFTTTLTANNVNKVKQAVYSFNTNPIDTNIVDIKLNPAAEALGATLNTTTTNLSAANIKSEVKVTFNGTKEVTGDIPMVDVTYEIPEMKDVKDLSSFAAVTSTFTSVDNVVTNPFTVIQLTAILPNFTSVNGSVQIQGLLKENGLIDNTKDVSKAGINVTVQDKQGTNYTGTVEKNGQFYITGLPLTRDELTFIQDIPGHFTTYNKMPDAFKTMDDEIYGMKKRLGTETIDLAIGGDVNKDNVIDVLDAVAIQSAWGTNTRNADINFDGIVDIKDFAFVEKNYLKQNPNVTNAPKAKKTYEGKKLETIQSELAGK